MALLVEDGVRYPFRGDRWTDLLAVGGLLGLVTSIALQLATAISPSTVSLAFVGTAAVPTVALLGYLYRVFETTVDGDDTPPQFRPITALLRGGCRLLAVSIGYAIGPLVVVAVTVGGLVQVPFAPEATGFVGSMLFFGASTTVLVLIVGFGYAFPATIGRLVDERRGLEPAGGRLQWPILRHGGYFTAWAFAALFVVPGWAFLLTAISSPTSFGVVAAFVAFYAHVVGARLVARGYRRARRDATP
ncbi:DUF4013 domain-containing protein [Natronobacterium gregoryi]|uniref:DUF4013 domain-containing protein n=2 Tax=Natronobacterium gregoryi TaxID=44930 RepID=L0ALR7_NATGS|nr:DUF4013 domain-containing protein [Natronobacterium gregoryi]AFZ74736.1 hypothetical protein Natgr_3624 [Natronobacterium gregoryi SP2]ELY73456.1 hypothetical protein C490_01285 [Natronobacterium gregoryi SP2]PLK20978.1 DUF4013 domain-containing protein [Natronobacterium gregoryi SP2]SFJ03716.1 Protein of unknown function [Natronobacterium gregoryi]